MSALSQFRVEEPTLTRYGVCVLLGLIGTFVAGATFQTGVSTPLRLFAVGTGLIAAIGWFGFAWIEASQLDELEEDR